MAASVLSGRYRLQETLSATAMAEVRLAIDCELDRRVVVKLLAPHADRGRFEREARAAAALDHPNIVRLFDFGAEAERPFMVFEHLSGGSLEERLSERPLLQADELTRVAADVAAGLAHAHERGVVHRDLKPANILFDSEDRAKIADLGIASLQGADTLTDAGTILGTVAYLSPEQTRGEPATPASDVYAYGVVLYRLLSGRLPFESAGAAELCAMHREAEPPPLAAGNEQLATLAMAALAKSPGERPADGAALLAALAAPTPELAASAAETQVLSAGRPRRRLKPTPLAGAVALVVLAGAGVLTAAVLTQDPAPAPATPALSSTAPQVSRTVPSRSTTARATSVSTTAKGTTASTSTRRTTTTSPSTRQETTTASVTVTTFETTVPEVTTSP